MLEAGSRWIIVSNRLPFRVDTKTGNFATSSGGLVSALAGIKASQERMWVGSAPENLSESDWKEKRDTRGENCAYHPVFLSEELYDLYYNGFCNDVLWPLLHYQNELVKFKDKAWQAYVEVNERMADEICSVAKETDLIWAHDFHLMLLPKLIKQRRPDLKVGFFLHVPFPSSEIFRQLPVREELLRALLHADLIGFHDYSYLRHFCSSVLRLLGIDSSFLTVQNGSRTTRLGVFPVSIDTNFFQAKTRSEKVRELARKYRTPHFQFLGIDRLDYIKGLDLKLKSFRGLLRQFPEFHEKVSLLQVAIPTRPGAPEFKRLSQHIAQLVGEINGEFSKPNWTPIQYLHSSVSNDELVALYKSADALLVTSKRDGMNLVAFEYIAAQTPDNPGVVLLSEFAGALSTLSHTIPVNPWDIEGTARKMKYAMELTQHERIVRLQTMMQYLRNYTATDWSISFMKELSEVPESKSRGPQRILPQAHYTRALAKQIIESGKERVSLLLDYDGTLVPIEQSPELAVLPEIRKAEISKLQDYPWLDVAIVSGRDSRFLERQFSGLPFVLAAEHGAKLFDPKSGRWRRRVHSKRATWYPTALKIISDYCLRTPRSQVEKKHFSISWHYRQSPEDYSEYQARKLAEELEFGLANLPVTILRGKKVIEVRATEADKGAFARWFIERGGGSSYAVGFGDDRTDEDLFAALQNRGVAIKIGAGSSLAPLYLPDQSDLMPFLKGLLSTIEELRRPFEDAQIFGKTESHLHLN